MTTCKFKIGDKVEVVDPSGCYNEYKQGEVGVVVKINKGSEGTLVTLEGKCDGMYDYRFKLAEEKKFDIKTIIKPFMRVVTKGGRWWIAADKDGEVVLVDPAVNSWNRINNIGEASFEEYEIVAVYDKPHYVSYYFNKNYYGNLIWEFKAKTEKQLKIEALEEEAAIISKLLAELKASN